MRTRPAPWVIDAALVMLCAAELFTVQSHVGPVANATYLLAVVALAFRRKWPVPVALATVPAAASGYLWLAPLSALGTAAALAPARLAVYSCAALVFLVGAAPKSLMEARDRTVDQWAAALIGPALFSIGPTALGQSARTRRELAVKLRELRQSEERERRLHVEMAVVEERARLAREMHDGVSHHVSLINIEAALLALKSVDDEARLRAQRIGELGGKAVDELRGVLGVLRGTGAHGRLPGLSELPELISASRLPVRAEITVSPGLPGLTPEVELAAYRTVQESLTNAAKHAPSSEIRVEVSTRAPYSSLRVEVANSPRTAARTPKDQLEKESGRSSHLGLIGLRERAVRLGGSMRAQPLPDGGFSVQVLLPLQTASDN
ncbi:sensor histidine kinase [Streptomyces sp. NPDC051561]|uniref:sensor histidine kinase n=1 Tax=Streptomyces sp. NPDC051561 TaxID=3365658 RepID=UPI0037A6B88B